jgi:hypothetical protein
VLKKDILNDIAEDGYNIGFGSCKSFATYDFANSWIRNMALASLIIGIIQLKIDNVDVNNKISIILIMLGVIAMSLAVFVREKDRYEDAGIKQRRIYNEMKSLYRQAQLISNDDYSDILDRKQKLLDEFYSINASDEIFVLSDIYAHYKFFMKIQYEWIDEQKKFRFWKDKVPNSVKVFVPIILIFSAAVSLFL